MTGYVGNFLGGLDQLLTVAGVAIVWLGLSALGALVAGRGRLAELDPVFGWAVLVALFTVAGVFTRLSFAVLAAFSAAAALVAAGVVLKRDRRLVTADLWRLCLLFAPLLLLASAMVASQWDEFSHWLPTQRYLFEAERFPTRDRPETGASFPAYPYAWPLLGYLASRAVGRFLESAGGVLNVMLLVTFALLTARLMRETLGRSIPTWSGLALGGLAVTLFNPTFVQKVVLTAYADVATAAMVGFAGVLAWKMLDAEAVGDRSAAIRLSWHAGLAFLVLVALKQATLVLFILIVGAVVLVALRDPAIRLIALIRLLPGLIVPPLVVYAVWRYHVANELSGREFTITPVSQWLVALIPEIVWKMITVLAKKGFYFALMLAAVAFGVRGFVRARDSFDRLAILVGAVFLGYNAFLLFTYVTAFGEFDALRAASLWRYNLHLGLLGVAFGVVGASLVWRRFVAERWTWSRVAWLPIVLMVALPIGFAPKLRFDREPPKPHFRAVAARVAAMMPAAAGVIVLDPSGSGESGVITKYHLDRRQTLTGYLSAFHKIDVSMVRSMIDQPRVTHALVHSVTPPVIEALGLALQGGMSYLLARDGAGWRVVDAWPYPPAKG
jgi:hypothetical protein